MIKSNSDNSQKVQKVNELPVKISFVGFPAVGKTTLLKLLTENTINEFYSPTMGFDFKTVKFGKNVIRVWDFGGQKAYLEMNLQNYVYGSDIVFIVTDSTPKNVLSSKELIKIAQDNLGIDGEIVVLANKQDLPGHMESNRVENIMQCTTYPSTAINPAERDRLIEVIQNELDKASTRRRMRNT